MAKPGVEIGSLLAGKYRLEKQLGKGGMGEVYLAENVDIGRKVAIKVLHAELAERDENLARFRQEARASAAIDHEGIVDVLDLGRADDGSPFIVMEHLEGESLGDHLQRVGRMRIADAVRVIDQVLDALGAAHDKNVIHRDLKPDNIFLVAKPKSTTKILDFGISKLTEGEGVSLTATGDVVGTPMYMPPEQARGDQPVTPASDLYAVGAVLYQAISGLRPFDGKTYAQVLTQVLTESPTPLERVRPAVPAALSTLVVQLMAKQPHIRPQSAREARELLATAMDGYAEPVPDEVDALDETAAGGRRSNGSTALAETAAASRYNADEEVIGTADAVSWKPEGDLALEVESVPKPMPASEAAPAPAPASQPPSRAGVWAAFAGVIVVAAVIASYVVVRGGSSGAANNDAAPVAGEVVPSEDARASAAPALGVAITSRADAGDVRYTIELSAKPDAATWSLGGQPLACNPCRVERPAGSTETAVASAPGYRSVSADLVFDGQMFEVTRTLERQPGSSPRDHDTVKSGGNTSDSDRDTGGDTGLTMPGNPLGKPKTQ